MTFSSLSFLCLFLPVTLAGYFQCRTAFQAKTWLLVASLVFYGSLDAIHLPWILLTTVLSWVISRRILVCEGRSKLVCLYAGLALNLGVLMVCKYVPGAAHPFPVGVSFYTLQLMAFLIDVYQGLIRRVPLLDMALFVGWFPRVVSGPLLDFRETLAEFEKPDIQRRDDAQVAAGLMLLFVGLAKKVLIADALSAWVQEGFSQASTVGTLEAWVSALSFTFQIYFDFSGYSDMAIGMARMFNIRLPANFDSPLQATGLIEFWSRWHMTLTRLITSYLYTPLVRAMGKVTFVKTLVATFVTMTIVGLWHGPAWTYVVFGAIHGAGLVVQHTIKRWRWKLPELVGRGMTFLTVVVAFVFFRAASVAEAVEMLRAMTGGHGLYLSDRFALWARMIWPSLILQVGPWRLTHMGYVMVTLPALFALVWMPHNSTKESERFAPTLRRALALAALIIAGLLHLQQYVPFVYVNF